ncbi:dihydroxyacetone kinase subunit L [Erwinia sp. S43]|uniref:dihydroxyacetone kinase subunit DhaL n=1 Tax=unclassified Erwinia TaxID=2622719 RepID=UPI00190AE893|nr:MULTISPECIES: dihydroxyacetone kinase subunit DhaL [unclassified Erwinia]MBK0035543.1 dihydroxyacetone kinase subunit L [Erwinia sp. S43]MCW1875375.1 dihydroxyacetone kinase subunit DhaL [Erwinia sp. INIA01]
MMTQLSTQHGSQLVSELVTVIKSNRDYLSEIDGAIGDGDHGINMAKGFTLCGEQLNERQSLAEAFDTLSDALMEGIGGSMGPLYGSFFMGMADNIRSKSALTANDFAAMLRAGLTELQDISEAGVGDKCLMDTLIPAVETAEQRADEGYTVMLQAIRNAARQGRDSTKDLVAKIGRASRLGERSRGVLDAGAVSCCLLLEQMAASAQQQLLAETA